MNQVVEEINHLICIPPISIDIIEALLGKRGDEPISWQEICLEIDPEREQIRFQGVDVWLREGGTCEKLLSSPNQSMEDRNCPWELIRVISETILTACGERFCIPLVRLIQGHRNSQLYLLRGFDYQRRHWKMQTMAIATLVEEME